MSAGSATEPPARGGLSEPADEDRARADLYALLAQLWYAAPDGELLASLAGSEGMFGGEDMPLGAAWNALARAARAARPAALSLEYDAIFVGVGKAAVTPYCSYYAAPAGRERIVVALRDELRELGLQRTGHSHEPEDHIAALCEVMRHLAPGGGGSYALEYQKRFFVRYIGSAYMQLTDAVLASEATEFYRAVARVTQTFFDVESQSFEMV